MYEKVKIKQIIKLRTHKNRNIIVNDSKQYKRCSTCDNLKHKDTRGLPNIVKSIITSDRRQGKIIKYMLKEDIYGWKWPKLEDKVWSDNEKMLVRVAFDQYEEISPLKFVLTNNENDAQIIINKKYSSSLGTQVAGDTLMGNPYYSVINVYYAHIPRIKSVI